MNNSVEGISFTVHNSNLDPDNVDIWLIPLDIPIDPKFAESLPKSEQKKASKFLSKERYHQYVLCWYAVRNILSEYIRCNTDDISIGYRKMGKPFLEHPIFQIDFSLSHSEQMGLLAISKQKRIGIDLEAVNFLKNIEDLSEFIMSEEEYALYKGVHISLKIKYFYKIFVRKEALLKGIGIGLYHPLTEITIWPLAEHTSKRSVVLHVYDRDELWTFFDFSFQYKGIFYQSSCFQEGKIGAIRYHFFIWRRRII